MGPEVAFIGAIIIATTQAVKEIFPEKISGALTIIVAMAVGLLVALLDTHIGLPNISVAVGILDGLAAVGVHAVASRIGQTS